MSLWAIALVIAVVLTLIQYGWRELRASPRLIPLALLRWGGLLLLLALVLDAPAGAAKRVAPWVALDGSLSMVRGAGRDTTVLKAARAAIRDAGGESLFVFGDSARRDTAGWPRDVTSKLQPAIDRAVAAGHPLVVITDGELDDPDATQGLPSGSRLIVVPHPAATDLAVASLEAPRAAVSGDTIEARVGLVAGAAGSQKGNLTLSLDSKPLGTTPLDSLAPFAERSVTFRVALNGSAGPAVLRAVASSAGDVEPRNDTLLAAIDVSRAATAVFVSTAPDFDARYALAVLRGALAIPTRGFFRVTPTMWRVDGTFAAASEQDVREALRDAPVAILHGDTSVFGPPRAITRGPLAMIVPASVDEGEWYAFQAPPSPLALPLSGVKWDSLPPIAVGPVAPKGSWIGAEAQRGRSAEHRPVIVGTDEPRRVVIVNATNLWRWSFRGGVAADAFTAWWGSIFDWLAAERSDKRAAVPEVAALRQGDPVRWRRGSPNDSVVKVVLARRNAPPRADSMTLHFATGVSVVETPPLATGLYDVTVSGGRALLVVNPSREWLPRASRVRSGAVQGVATASAAPTLRSLGWVYVAVVLLLCVEWTWRRRRGMR